MIRIINRDEFDTFAKALGDEYDGLISDLLHVATLCYDWLPKVNKYLITAMILNAYCWKYYQVYSAEIKKVGESSLHVELCLSRNFDDNLCEPRMNSQLHHKLNVVTGVSVFITEK